LNIIISGATGLIGTNLCLFLQSKGHTIKTLNRKKSKGSSSISWNPETGEGNLADFEGFDAVIHLAGENIAKGFWTSSKKKRILESRQKGTENLVFLLKKLEKPPKVFVSASAVGYYGSLSTPVTESSPLGFGFLAEVCKAWESSPKLLEPMGVRTVQARFGIILSLQGGILKALLPLFRLGLGAKIASGKQMISWVALEDVMGALLHILTDEALKGPVNIVSPHPVSQEVFAKSFAKALSKPCFFRIPRFLLQGEKAKELLLSSLAVVPSKLQLSGYCFFYPTLEAYFKSAFSSF
jgi:uncharacterized protein (TIGR01777 family)